MAKQSTKNYIRGGAKATSFPDGGSVINLDLNLADINALPVNERGYIKISVAERQSVDQYGNSHYVYENTYKPKEASARTGSAPESKGKPSFKKPGSDMPF